MAKRGDFDITCKRFKNWLVAKQNKLHDFDFEKRFENWVRLPTINFKQAAVDAYMGLGTCFALGIFSDRLINNTCFICAIPKPSPQSQFLSLCGGYRPLVESFLARGPYEKGNNFTLMMGCNATIAFVMNNIRGGKEDVYTSMVAGFGYGVMISLVTGMRGPSVIPAAAGFALLNVGMYKAGIKMFKVPL